MRRFIIVTVILVVIVALAGAVAGDLLLYDSYRRKQIQLDVHATLVSDLDGRLGAAESGRGAAENRADALEQENRALGAQLATRESEVATLQAEVARPPIPTPTVATGTPLGICTIERSESCPLSGSMGTGTPMTGSSV